jgi:hypothetical protein
MTLKGQADGEQFQNKNLIFEVLPFYLKTSTYSSIKLRQNVKRPEFFNR